MTLRVMWRTSRASGRRPKSTSPIGALQAAFRDPTSPYHIPPGQKGPESPNHVPLAPKEDNPMLPQVPSLGIEHPDKLEAAEAALLKVGFLRQSLWRQQVQWGDHDAFQHVNNVRYVRYFESSRINWMYQLGFELDGKSKAEDLIEGRGVSLIMKSIKVDFRRPVTFPDTLLISHRPYVPELPDGKTPDPAALHLRASAYSLAQQAFVAHAEEIAVWYDYDQLKKRVPEDRVAQAVWKQLRTPEP